MGLRLPSRSGPPPQIIGLFYKTTGIPRNAHAKCLEPTDEMPDIAHEPDGDDDDFDPSEQNFNGGISADAR